MHASATSVAPIVADGAAIHVPVPGQGEALRLFDGRPKLHWTEAEVQQAVETQQKKAGALVALVRERIEATWSEIRRELNEAAGGTASARVMVLAHHAMRAHQALELQTLLAEVAAGEHGEGKRADPNNGLRNQSGLSVIATQALNQAYEAARSEAGNRSSPTAQLMNRLGVGQGQPKVTDVQQVTVDPGSSLTHGSVPPGLEVHQAYPSRGMGGSTFGSLSPLIPDTYEVPVPPPGPPVPGGSK